MIQASINKVRSGSDRIFVIMGVVGIFISLSPQISGVTLARQKNSSPKETVISPAPGSIVGSVRMVGPYKKLEPLPVFKNKEFCGSSVPDESLLVNVDGGIENAVVILHGASNHFEKSSRKIVLDNKACRFAPHVQVARLGSEVVLRNSDPILHDVHARLNSNTLFNVGLPTWRQVKRRLTKAGIVKIECEVLHTWMSAFIVVTSSPYFAVTGADGRFSIAGVPVGDYELEVWHERLGRQSKTVTILEGLRSEVNFDFP